MADIFISYKREDKPKAALLAGKITAAGWSAWWDHDLLGGEDYDVVIERELTAASCVIVIWSALSRQSRNVKDEARKALNRDALVPVTFDYTDPPIGFGMTHIIQFAGSRITENELAKLYESIAKKAGNPGQPLPQPVIKKKTTGKKWMIPVSVITAAAIFFAVRGFQNRQVSNNAQMSSYHDPKGDTAKPADTTGYKKIEDAVPSDEEKARNYFNSNGNRMEAALPGDSILHYRLKQINASSIKLEVDYNYNTAHGNTVYLGAWLWPLENAAVSGGYIPVHLSTEKGTAEITITVSELDKTAVSDGFVIMMSEPYKKPFTVRLFKYRHKWEPVALTDTIKK
jgi:TIR domain